MKFGFHWKIFLFIATLTSLLLGCRQIWDSSEPVPPLPEYSIFLDDIPAIKVGSTYEVIAKTSTEGVAITTYDWISEDESVVTVTGIPGTASATVQAVSASPKNSAFIQVRTTDSEGRIKEATPIEVQTYTEVESLALSGPFVVFLGSGELLLTAHITPESAQTVPLAWSRTGEVATDIDASTGVITVKDTGVSTITAKAQDSSGKTDDHTLFVVDFPAVLPPSLAYVTDEGAVWVEKGTSIVLPSPAPLGPEFNNLLSVGSPQWVSTKTDIAETTDTQGEVRGVSSGISEVTLTNTYTYEESTQNLIAQYDLYVTELQITNGVSTIEAGSKVQLGVALTQEVPGLDLENITWISSDSSLVSVSEEGEIIGSSGSATIIAIDEESGLEASIEVEVTGAAVSAITIVSDNDSYSIPVKRNDLNLSLLFEPEGASDSVSWETSDSSIATITGAGDKAVVVSNGEGKTGSVVVTASSKNSDVVGVLPITVYDIAISGNSGIDDNGGSTELSVVITPQDERTKDLDLRDLGDITWTIDAGASIAELSIDEEDRRSVKVSSKVPAPEPGAQSREIDPSFVTITVEAGRGLLASRDIVINPVATTGIDIVPPSTYPSGVVVDEDRRTITMSVDTDLVLSTSITPDTATNRGVQWSVSPEGIVRVDGGVVQALSPGTAQATATAKGAKAGETVEATYTVKVRDFSITYGKEYLPLGLEGDTLSAQIIPAGAGELQLTWMSDSPNIVQIDKETGVLTPISGGSATISATDSTTQLIRPYTIKVAELEATSNRTVIEQGESTTLGYTVKGISQDMVGELSWRVTEETPERVGAKVISLDLSGSTPVVEGVSPGTALIEVFNSLGLSSSITITVTHIPAKSVKIDRSITTVAVNSQELFTAAITPENITTGGVVWEIIEESPEEEGNTVARIDQGGRLSAQSTGTVTIQVTTKDSVESDSPVTDTHRVTVVDLLATPSSIELKKGDSADLGYTITPSSGLLPSITTYEGYNKEIVSVDGGAVKGVSPGTTFVTATDETTGLTAKTKVHVWDIAIEGDPTLPKGGSAGYQLVTKPSNEVITSTDEKQITWLIDDPNWAWVDSDGKVTAEVDPRVTTKSALATVRLIARYDGLEAVFPIVINGIDVTGITLISPSQDVHVKDRVQMRAEVTPANASNTKVLWSLGEGGDEFASIDDSGVLRGIKPGYVKVIATADGSVGRSVVASAEVAVIDLEATFPELIYEGTSFTVGVKIVETGAATNMEQWKSSDETVATVDSNGNVKALSYGTTTITAVDEYTGLMVDQPIVVYGLVIGGLETVAAGGTSSYTVSLEPASLLGDISLGDVVWSASAGSIEDGYFEAPQEPGVVTLTAKDLDNRISGTFDVVVTDKKVEKITITNGKNIHVAERLTLEASLEPVFATNKKVTWSVYNSDGSEHDGSIATIASDGTIQGVAPGVVTVTATALGSPDANDPLTASTSIAVQDFMLSLDTQDLFVKERATVTATLLPSGTADVSWKSSNEGVATVEGGVVEGVSRGTTTIIGTDAITNLTRKVTITVSDIEIRGEKNSLIKGDSLSLKLVKVPSGEDLSQGVTWSVSNPNLAWVTQEGEVTAEPRPILSREMNRQATPNQIIVYAKLGGLTAEYPMTINPLYVTGIAITPTEGVQVNVGEDVTLTAKVSPENASNTDVSWSIDPSQYAIAQVDASGVVKGNAPGQVTVTATAKGTAEGSTLSTNKIVTVNDLALSFPKTYLLKGAEFVPVVHILPGESNLASIEEWQILPDGVLSYDESSGTFTALKGGSTSITGKDKKTGLTRTFGVNVVELLVSGPSSVEQGNTSSSFSASLSSGDSSLTLGTVNWSAVPSNRVEIIVPTEGGTTMQVKGLSPGPVVITATDSNGIRGTAQLEVTYVPVTSVTITGENVVTVNSSIQLDGQVDANATDQGVVWSIADGGEEFGSVDKQGKVTGISVGTLKVLATAKGDSSQVGEHSVTVRDLSLSTEKDDIYKGETLQVEASIIPKGSGTPNITKWDSSKDTIATVSGGTESALVEGKSSGYVTITITDEETGLLKSEQITVSDIEIRAKSSVLLAGETMELELYKIPAGEKISEGVTWTSNRSEVATVDKESGLVTALTTIVAAGNSATIEARLGGTNLSASYPITVDGVKVESIVIRDPDTLFVGVPAQLEATVLPENASNKKVLWGTEADESLVTVDRDGGIVGLQPGTIKVNATALGGELEPAEKVITVKDLNLGVPERAFIEKEITPLPVMMPYDERVTVTSWVSTDPEIASIHATTGTITTHSGGTTTIIGTYEVTDKEGNTITLTRKEDLSVAELIISTTEDTIAQGGTTSMTVRLESGKENLSLGAISWSFTSSDGGSVVIDTSGDTPVVKGVSPGTVRIKGVDTNGVTGYVTLKVTKQDVMEISIVGGSIINLGANKPLSLSTQLLPAKATDTKVRWNITAQKPVKEGVQVATVSQDGVVSATSAGVITVTATALGSADGTLTATHEVIVRELVIEGPTNPVNVSKDTPFILTANYVPQTPEVPSVTSWKTSKDTVVQISFDAGKSVASATAVGPGAASITATDAYGATANITINTQQLVIIGGPSIHEGQTTQLDAQLLPDDTVVTTEVVWSSYDTTRAWVGESGLVTASPKPEDPAAARMFRSLPPVTIQAIHKETGLVATHTLAIVDSPATDVIISVDGFGENDKVRVPVGGSLQLSKEVLPLYATDKSVTWSISPESDQSLATISEKTGLLVAGDTPGFVEVIATANGAGSGKLVVASQQVYITKLSFMVEPRSWITKDGNFTSTFLQVKMEPASAEITPSMKWNDPNRDIVTVSSEGKVVGGTTAGTVTLIGTDTVTGQTIDHKISLVELSVSLHDWVAKGQTKKLEVSLLPQDIADSVDLSLNITAPGSTNEISVIQNTEDSSYGVKGIAPNREDEQATIKILDNTTGLAAETSITVVALQKKESATSWIKVHESIDLAKHVEIIPRSAGVTPDIAWKVVRGTVATVESSGQVVAGSEYGTVTLQGVDSDNKTGHQLEYKLDVVDIEIVNAPTLISSANGKVDLDIVVLPKYAGLLAQESWVLTTGERIVDFQSNGLVTAKGEAGTITLSVTDATTGITKLHTMEAVDFVIIPEAGESKPYLFPSDTLSVQALLSTEDDFSLNLQWSSIPEGYLSISETEDLTATLTGVAPYGDKEGITIQAKDVTTGLVATYSIPVVGIRLKENQPAWTPVHQSRPVVVETIPKDFELFSNPTFTWSVDKNAPAGMQLIPAGVTAGEGKVSVKAGDTSGYVTVTATEDSTGLSVSHTMTVVELLIDRGTADITPISTSSVSPNKMAFNAWLNPSIQDAPNITWEIELPNFSPAEGTVIDESTGVATIGEKWGNAFVWAKDATTGLAKKLDLTVMSFVLEQASRKPYIASGSEGVFKPVLKPKSAKYLLEDLRWNIVNEDGDPSWLATFPEDNQPTDSQATVRAGKIPGKVWVQAIHPDSGIVVEQEVYIATIETKLSPNWTPVTKGSNYKNLVAEIIPKDLVAGSDPIIQIPEYVWEVIPQKDTADPSKYDGVASIVGDAKNQIKGDSYGRVQVRVTETESGLSTVHDMWVVEFIFEGEKPSYLTVGGDYDRTTLIPAIRPEKAGVTPEVVGWTNSNSDSIHLDPESGVITGLANHKGVAIEAFDKITGESVVFTAPVLEYEIIEDAPVWVNWNEGTRTFTGRYLPVGIDVASLGITPTIEWSENSPFATMKKETTYTGTVTTEAVDENSNPEDKTGDFIVRSLDKSTGLSAQKAAVVGALVVEGVAKVNRGGFSDLELFRYPASYGTPVPAWTSKDPSHLSIVVSDLDTNNPLTKGVRVRAESYKLEQDTSVLGRENWFIPEGDILVVDRETGLDASFGIAVGPDVMRIIVNKQDSLHIPVSNSNLLIDTDGNGYYAKNDPRYTFSHPGGEVVITELNDTIQLQSWKYNNGNMRNALVDVTAWGHADFTDANGGVFREYTQLAGFSAEGTPILGGDLSYMFYNNNVFTGKGLQFWDVSEVTHMNYMFQDADGLIGLYEDTDDQGNVVTKNVFTPWNVRNVVEAMRLFRDTDNFTANDMSDKHWDSLVRGDEMFYGSNGVIGERMNNWSFSSLGAGWSNNSGRYGGISEMFIRAPNYTGKDSHNWQITAQNFRSYYGMFHDQRNIGPLVGWSIHVLDRASYKDSMSSLFLNRANKTLQGFRNWTFQVDGMDTAANMFQEYQQITGVDMAGWTFPGLTNASNILSTPGDKSFRNITGVGMNGWTFPDAPQIPKNSISNEGGFRNNANVDDWIWVDSD